MVYQYILHKHNETFVEQILFFNPLIYQNDHIQVIKFNCPKKFGQNSALLPISKYNAFDTCLIKFASLLIERMHMIFRLLR